MEWVDALGAVAFGCLGGIVTYEVLIRRKTRRFERQMRDVDAHLRALEAQQTVERPPRP